MLQLEQQSVADADAAQRPALEIGICHSGHLNFTEALVQKVKSLTELADPSIFMDLLRIFHDFP